MRSTTAWATPLSWSYWRIAASPCSHHLKASVTQPALLGPGTPGTGCAAAGAGSAPSKPTAEAKAESGVSICAAPAGSEAA
eukprot:5138083-Alexandrium_andersonii.AAC.1